MSLKKLINSCKQKDIKAQSQIYQLYAGKLFGLCLKYSKNYEEAQDNLHNGFITIFEKIEQYEHKGSFEGWLKRIIINTSLQTYRKKNVLSLVNEEIPDVEVEVELDEEDIQLDFLLNLIQELPERYQMVFNLYVLDGYPHKEIAKMLNISEGTSKSNLSRARVILRDKIEANQLMKNEAL
ncbi:sigma-70 family RNA polymerase sigma factor [Aureibaculum sp. A20]|uniref:Sigma-70 family RNA polymerase sigma factor n=1 Tax=Aureibaculum flavum TaxID=2795986 RepID=A0ABS0WQ96_9FLAO|nr:sigma-70 family RNA polymerase sigma factor [Aureibaculum flavum]MBJ2174096.1 sigma-70 family RNA polymerase sigma factor [Aureibaculum flavum]